MSLRDIYQGWSKRLRLQPVTEAEQELAKARVAVCVTYNNGEPCEFAKEEWLSTFVDGFLKNDEDGSGLACSICHCPVNAAAWAPDKKCPKNRWPK